MSECVYIYIYIHIHIHTHLGVCVRARLCMCVSLCMCVCVCVCVCIYICVYVNMYVCVIIYIVERTSEQKHSTNHSITESLSYRYSRSHTFYQLFLYRYFSHFHSSCCWYCGQRYHGYGCCSWKTFSSSWRGVGNRWQKLQYDFVLRQQHVPYNSCPHHITKLTAPTLRRWHSAQARPHWSYSSYFGTVISVAECNL